MAFAFADDGRPDGRCDTQADRGGASRNAGAHTRGCIDKPIGRDVAAIDGPRAAGIVVTIMMTLVTFVITKATAAS